MQNLTGTVGSNSAQGSSSGGGGSANNPNQGFGVGSTSNRSCNQGFDGRNFDLIEDDDPSIAYFGSWSIINGNPHLGLATQHITTDPTASLNVQFIGTTITVIGTAAEGTEPIVASYSVDGGQPQTRNVPTSTQCDLILVSFFSMSGLKNETHYINITMVNVTTRPYELNFLALDLKVPPSAKKSHLGEVAGGVSAGVVFCVLFLGFMLWFRRRSRLKLVGTTMVDDEKTVVETESVTVCSNCKVHLEATSYNEPFKVGPILPKYILDPRASPPPIARRDLDTWARNEAQIPGAFGEGKETHTRGSRYQASMSDSHRASVATSIVTTGESRTYFSVPMLPPVGTHTSLKFSLRGKQREGVCDDGGKEEVDVQNCQLARAGSSSSGQPVVVPC